MAIIYTKNGDQILIDDEDYERLCEFSWYIDDNGYARTDIRHNRKRKHQYMHRLIMNVTDSKVHVDHINHDRADNRQCNLRLASQSENARNRGTQKNSQSGVKGLSYLIRGNSWQAQIMLNGINHTKSFSINKYHDAKQLAIDWLDEKRPILHGKFSRS